MYPVGPRIEAALRAEVLANQQTRHRQREAQAMRVKRGDGGVQLSEAQRQQQAEQLFIVGLQVHKIRLKLASHH